MPSCDSIMRKMAMKQEFSCRMRGFTLIELLVVLVILGLLAGLVGPQVIKYLGGANTKTAKLQIEDFSTCLLYTSRCV